MVFSVRTKNLNWEILTKNLVTPLKDGMALRMKNFDIMGVHWKIWFSWGLHKKPIFSRELPKKGDLVKKRAGGAFEVRGWYVHAHNELASLADS